MVIKKPIKNRKKKLYNPKPSKQIARDYIRMDDKQLRKELAKKMLNQYYFTVISNSNLNKIGLRGRRWRDARSN